MPKIYTSSVRPFVSAAPETFLADPAKKSRDLERLLILEKV